MAYIHPCENRIEAFAKTMENGGALQALCRNLLTWFETNVAYSRLQAPFTPLQRSDLDVLAMHAGTCGDYANLIVSVLINRGYKAAYAYVHRDCYGHAQDHICAAVWYEERWCLIDATAPYRNWYGFDCPHRDYELLSCDAFEEKMKAEEVYWQSVASRRSNEKLSGLLYAPWLHEQVVMRTPDVWDSVFFLLVYDESFVPALYVYYQHYTKQIGKLPVMAVVHKENTQFRLSVHACEELWGEEQWGDAYQWDTIPEACRTQALFALRSSLEQTMPIIWRILEEANEKSRR